MRMVALRKCTPGMRLAKSIFSVDGRVLLAKNIELTAPLIRKLEEYGVAYLYIQDPMLDDLEADSSIPDEVSTHAVAKIRQLFQAQAQTMLNHIAWNKLYRELDDIFETVYREILQHRHTMFCLNQIYTYDAYLYKHCYQVGVYSMIIAVQHNYPKEKVREVALGSFLHDIGKLCIPREIVNKAGPLTQKEMEEVQRHTVYGYDILRQYVSFPLLSAHIALQHHERLDGSGYPRKLKGDEIHEYAKMVSIADVYDALTSKRAYRDAVLPSEAMEELYAGSGRLYDTRYLTTFRNSIVLYPVGLTVVLSTGERAVVVDNNTSAPQRPIVRVYADAEGQAVTPYELDLSKALTVQIVQVEL